MITADSIPDLDDWWFDEWWTCDQWIMWHKANKKKYGQAVANQKFMEYWNQQTFGAGALDCRTFDSKFRAYITRNNLYDAVYEGAGLFKHVLGPIGGASDVVGGASRTLGAFGRALPWIVGISLGGVAIWGGVKVYKSLRR